MALVTRYVREGQLYTKDYLREHFDFVDDLEFAAFLKQLKKYRVLKTIKGKNSKEEDESLLEDDDEDYIGVIDDNSQMKYLFRYVGLLTCKGRVIYVYPKYIEPVGDYIPKKEMRQVINVLRKYNKACKDIIKEYSGKEGKEEINLLSLMVFFIQDYLDHGLYSNDEEITEINGSDNYLWQKTIDETFPIIRNNRPYYTEIYTLRRVFNEDDFTRRLHAWIITDVCQQMKETGLADIYGYPHIEISSEIKKDFGDDQYISKQIEDEVRLQFDDRKIILLHAMNSYIVLRGKMRKGDEVMFLLGTRTFHMVWEEVCAKVFKSERNEKLYELGSRYTPLIDYTAINPLDERKELIELIRKPKWMIGGITREPKETFVPDFLSFYTEGGMYYYYILDAKYYCPELNGHKISKNPGVEDVAKQYLYYLAYKQFLDGIKITFNNVRNYFLMPKETGDIEDMGYVELELWNSIPSIPRQVRIKKLPADMMYEKYISDQTIPLNQLDAVI